MTMGGWKGNLYGIADYSSTNTNDVCILKISSPSGPGDDDWYISFNRRAGVNDGTKEGKSKSLCILLVVIISFVDVIIV